MEQIYVEMSTDSIPPPTELDEVVVTASKVNLPLSLAAKQVTIISRQEIERAPVRSIEDLLNYVAGVDILQRGPHGVQADISLRGGSFDQTAILLNGVNLTNPKQDITVLTFRSICPISNVSRSCMGHHPLCMVPVHFPAE